MMKIKTVAAAIIATGLLFGTQSAEAHCDSVDGPVATAAQKALDTGNVTLALPYAPAAAESELKATFAQSLKVRTLGPDAKALADRAFIEVAVRLHRAGEGATYTGLKASGTDFGPAIPAAERAIESRNLSQVKALISEEIEHGLHKRFAHALATAKAAKEPKTEAEVAATRERVSAELGFVTYVESLRQAAHGAAGHHE